MDYITCPFEVKAGSNSNDGYITGYGSIFGNVDSYGDIVAKGAFKKAIEDAKSGAKSWPAFLLQHGDETSDGKMPVGIWTNMEEDSNGLKLVGETREHETWPRRLCAFEDDSPACVGWSLNRLPLHRLRNAQGRKPGTPHD